MRDEAGLHEDDDGQSDVLREAMALVQRREDQVRRQFGTIRVGVQELNFCMTYSPWQYARNVWARYPQEPAADDDARSMEARAAAMGEAYRRAVHDELTAVAPQVGWNVPATRPDETRGSGGDTIALLFDLAAFVNQHATTLATWLTLAALARAG